MSRQLFVFYFQVGNRINKAYNLAPNVAQSEKIEYQCFQHVRIYACRVLDAE